MDRCDDKPVIYDDDSSVSEHSPQYHRLENPFTAFSVDCQPAEFGK